jgi:predicted permease
MVLLVGAGLVGRSFVRLTRVDPGFEPERALVASFTLPGSRYDDGEKIVRFQAEVAQRIAALPGVQAAGMTNIAPFSGGSTAMPITPVGSSAVGPGEYVQAAWRSVTPGYFPALGIRLLRGRFIDETDREQSPPVIVITQSFAQRVWPGEDPVGRQIKVGDGQGQPWTIVGVVGDLRDQALDQEPRALMYVPFRQIGWPSMWLVVRTQSADPVSVAGAVRKEVWAVDKNLPLSSVQPLTDLVNGVAAQPRLTMFIFALFASAALILAVVGIYGIVAYSVIQRTREIGVQLALGARPARIVGGVVRQGVLLAGVGIVIGLGAAYLLSRFVAGILYGIPPRDAATYGVVATVLAASAVLASLVPARAASRLDPVLALRQE